MKDTPNVNTAPVTLNHRRVNGKVVDVAPKGRRLISQAALVILKKRGIIK